MGGDPLKTILGIGGAAAGLAAAPMLAGVLGPGVGAGLLGSASVGGLPLTTLTGAAGGQLGGLAANAIGGGGGAGPPTPPAMPPISTGQFSMPNTPNPQIASVSPGNLTARIGMPQLDPLEILMRQLRGR